MCESIEEGGRRKGVACWMVVYVRIAGESGLGRRNRKTLVLTSVQSGGITWRMEQDGVVVCLCSSLEQSLGNDDVATRGCCPNEQGKLDPRGLAPGRRALHMGYTIAREFFNVDNFTIVNG